MAIVEALLPSGTTVPAYESITPYVNDIMVDTRVPKRVLPVGRNPRKLAAPKGRIGVASMTVFEDGSGLVRVHTVYKARDDEGLLVLYPETDAKAHLPGDAAFYVVTNDIGSGRRNVQLLFFHEEGLSPSK